MNTTCMAWTVFTPSMLHMHILMQHAKAIRHMHRWLMACAARPCILSTFCLRHTFALRLAGIRWQQHHAAGAAARQPGDQGAVQPVQQPHARQAVTFAMCEVISCMEFLMQQPEGCDAVGLLDESASIYSRMYRQ